MFHSGMALDNTPAPPLSPAEDKRRKLEELGQELAHDSIVLRGIIQTAHVEELPLDAIADTLDRLVYTLARIRARRAVGHG